MSRTLTWADLFATGSLVDLDVSMWDGLVRIRPADLGIPETDEVKRALTFGHERLVGKAALQEIRDHCYNARRKIDDYTLAFDLIPGSRFIPKSQREALHKFLEDAHGKFQAAANKFLAGYAEERRKQQEVLRKALLAATDGQVEIVDRAMARITALYPGETTLRYKFNMTWQFFSIAAPQDGTASSDGSAEGDALRRSLGGMVDKLRERLAAKVHAIMDLAQKGGRITAKTYNSANRLLDRLVELNVFGDPGLSETIAAVRLALNTAQSSENGAAALVTGLQNVEAKMTKSRDEAIKAVSDRIVGMADRRLQL